MANIIENKTFDEERALYGSHGVILRHCAFDGPADGESALKESADVTMEDGFCNLRYPFWHVHGLHLTRCELTPLCRAALWYSTGIAIADCRMHGIKALRECEHVRLVDTDIQSPEFGWSTHGIEMENCTATGEYFMMRAEDLHFNGVTLTGKYAFQYVKNAVFENCRFDTKDSLWHAENVTVRNSVIKGEYFSWYSKGLTLENCIIIGTQPLCYCKDLRLVNCEMRESDLAFEKSEVHATLTAPIISIKNPYSGEIRVPAMESLIQDDPAAKCVVHVEG